MADDASPHETVKALRATFERGLTRDLDWRREELRALKRLLAEGEADLLDALRADLGKPVVESQLTELAFVRAEIDVMLKNLGRWARPERVGVPLVQQPGHAEIVREPFGVALVVAPWNYPVHLLLLPMAAAIAAGNCVVGKPSELAPNTAATVARLATRHLDGRAVVIVEGGPDEVRSLLDERFDTIFYTGSARVARSVMAAAARHLTPVTLELGGKSPAIVDASADIGVAARRVAWGKYLNAGQSCVAPDYVLVHERVEEQFVDALCDAVGTFYGADPRASADYARIVNDAHFDRIAGLLSSTAGHLALGGQTVRAERYVAPTVLTGVGLDDPVMEAEIFGPVLPVVTVRDVGEAVRIVKAGEKPLALYVFARSEEVVDQVVGGTSSGGVGVNCTVVQLAVPGLPFGGVGESGMGAYHGRTGFETFSHRRAVLAKPTRPDPPVQYPPFTTTKAWILKKML